MILDIDDYKIALMLELNVNMTNKQYFVFVLDLDLNDQLIHINFDIYLNINKLMLN